MRLLLLLALTLPDIGEPLLLLMLRLLLLLLGGRLRRLMMLKLMLILLQFCSWRQRLRRLGRRRSSEVVKRGWRANLELDMLTV